MRKGTRERNVFAEVREGKVFDLADRLLAESKKTGETLVTAALHARQPAAALALIHLGASLEVDGKGDTPMCIASAIGAMDVIDALMAKGVDVNAISQRTGRTPLCEALNAWVLRGNHLRSWAERAPTAESTALHLISLGADVNRGNPLITAAEHGFVAAVRELIARGAQYRYKREGGTPLKVAYGVHPEVVELLVEMPFVREYAEKLAAGPERFMSEDGDPIRRVGVWKYILTANDGDGHGSWDYELMPDPILKFVYPVVRPKGSPDETYEEMNRRLSQPDLPGGGWLIGN